jgi:D-alanyl-D-alanine carboxypeptidase
VGPASGLASTFAPERRKDTNFIFLGLLLQAVTDTSVGSLLRSRIIEPLGLRDTYLAGSEEGLPVIRTPIGLRDRVVGGEYPYTSIATSAWTAGAMVSSARDLGAFFSALFDGRLVSESALELVHHRTRFRAR